MGCAAHEEQRGRWDTARHAGWVESGRDCGSGLFFDPLECEVAGEESGVVVTEFLAEPVHHIFPHGHHDADGFFVRFHQPHLIEGKLVDHRTSDELEANVPLDEVTDLDVRHDAGEQTLLDFGETGITH